MQRSESSSPDHGPAIIELDGEFDTEMRAATLDEVRRMLAQRPSTIAVDLSRVSFMDCAGAGTLIEARAIAEQAGCALYVRSLSDPAAWLLDLTGLLDHLTHAPGHQG